MRAFIMPGDNSHLREVVPTINDRVSAVMLHQREPVASIALPAQLPSHLSGRVFSLHDLNGLNHDELGDEQRRAHQGFVEFLLNDSRAHYLAQRSKLDSAFNNAVLIEQIAYNSQVIIGRIKPTCLISSSAPHSLAGWVFAKCFEYFDLPIYVLESTAIAFRSWLVRGLEAHEVIARHDVKPSDTLARSTTSLVEKQSVSRAGAKDADGYQVSRIYLNSVKDSDTNKWWSNKRELSWLFSGKLRGLPYRLFSTLRKRRLLRSYERHSVRTLPESPYVVFFAHYQPERSTLPIGFQFVQQWLAIRMLSRNLPAGWKLLVREHPTTWYKPIDLQVRTATYYDDIASLPGTHICSMDIDTFDLIDNCAVAATITGSSGFQSLIRGKAVLSFGLAPYKDHPACLNIERDDDVTRAFEQVQRSEFDEVLNTDGMTRYLKWVEQHSVCMDEDEPDWREVRLKNFVQLYSDALNDRLQLDAGDEVQA